MAYHVKESFYTLQGEGAHTGRPAVFLRFAGCNLWNGLEGSRSHAVCTFCDTDFVGTDGDGGGRFSTAAALADAVARLWPITDREAQGQIRYVVCTGGEPLLQLDPPAIDALHGAGFEIGLETNGTIAAPAGIDWLCVSPKAGATLKILAGDELKLVYPQAGVVPEEYEGLAFGRFSLQPMDGPDLESNTKAALAYCLSHPRWRLSLQTHKLLGIR